MFTALKLQISFCQDSLQNISECPYVYKQNRILIQVHGCWLKQLMSPIWNTTETVMGSSSNLQVLIEAKSNTLERMRFHS